MATEPTDLPVTEPIAFVRPGRPPTSNRNLGQRGEKFQQDVRDLYAAAGGLFDSSHRYGVVYYFRRGYWPATDADAGNLGKRVWDSLNDVAFKDDNVVRLQIAGVVNIGDAAAGGIGYQDLDLTAVPGNALAKLLALIDGGAEHHILYVEIGTLSSSMFVFNLARGRAL